jgi:choice-of-anchor A domain-containing protein
MRRLRLLCCALVLALLVSLAAVGPSGARRVIASAGASDCASFGEAASYVAFSHGDFNASPPGGENINGRVAAAGDVTLGGSGSGGVYITGLSAPTVIAGGNFSAGKSGTGGTLSTGVRYGGDIYVASNFYINGNKDHAQPPFSFDDEFDSLKLLSASWADLDQTPGATVTLNQYSHALELTGTGDDVNVFRVDAAQLAQAAGVVINLNKPDATALINVTTDTELLTAFQYLNLSGTATAAKVAWNLPLATALTISGSVSWQGLVLAPNATVNEESNGQFNGQLIAGSIPTANRTMNLVAFTGCLPPPEPIEPPAPPDETLTLTALCVSANGDLTMRLRNSGDERRQGEWVDLGGPDFGTVDVPAGSDEFFDVQDPSTQSVIRLTSGSTTITEPGVTTPCSGQITVRLATIGPAPPGATWNVGLDNGANVSRTLTLASGDQETTTVPGGYVSGTAPIDEVIGGVAYTVSVGDTHGGAATISLNPVEILDGDHEIVTVTITYTASGGGGGTEVVPPPVQPTLPPGAPDPPRGPDLVGGRRGTDLSITHLITPRRLYVGGTIMTVTRVRNVGREPAVGVVTREIPQYHPETANAVARVLSLTTTRGTCTSRRPVRCTLGTLAPSASVTIRSRTRVLVAAPLRSMVVVSSKTKETNTANNTAVATFVSLAPRAVVHAHVSAPPTSRVAAPLRYTARATGGGQSGATSVRLCTRPPSSMVQAHAPGTFLYRGTLCRSVSRLGRGHSISFTVFGYASARGHIFPSARATAVDVARADHAAAHVLVLGASACPAAASRASGTTKPPTAHAAC